MPKANTMVTELRNAKKKSITEKVGRVFLMNCVINYIR